MHPEDIRNERFKERIASLRKFLEKDEAEVDAASKDMDRILKALNEHGIPKEYGGVLEALSKVFERVGRNRLEIRQLTIEFFESIDLLHREIDVLSEKISGLDENR